MKVATLKDFSTIRDLSVEQAKALTDTQDKIMQYVFAYHTMKITSDEYLELMNELFSPNRIENFRGTGNESEQNQIVLKKEIDLLFKLAHKVLMT